MVQILTQWPREREGVPFDTAAFNRIVNFLQGNLAAPFRLVQTGGNLALSWDPTLDLFVFRSSIQFHATLTLGNTIWLDGYKAGNTVSVHLIRVNASDVIEIGAAAQRLSFLASLTNNTNLSGRNAANSASITLVKLNTSDVVELGETGAQDNLLGTVNIVTGPLQIAGDPGTVNKVPHGGATPAWGSVATADIEADAVTQLLSPTPSTSSPNMASATYATIPEMTQAITTVGGKVSVRFSGAFYNSVGANNATFALAIDGGTEVAASERTISLAAGSLALCVATEHVFTGVAAGAHTITARWKTAGGTLNSLVLQRTLVVTEIKR